jgi:DNA processing protein
MPDDCWLALLQAAGGADHRCWLAALREAGSAAALADKSTGELRSFGLGSVALQRLRKPDLELTNRWGRWLTPPHRRLIPFGSPDYPKRLEEVPDAPLALWAHGGGSQVLRGPQLAVVGSRNPTGGGIATAEAFARYASARGVTVTSGLAMGIDAAAHRGALRGDASTIAVLGCGIDAVYPRCNGALAAEITTSGVVVSEYPPGTPARAFRFPQRNRIIAGMTLGTLVVEATRRSGSLITARLAADYGREVFAIPGSIHNPLSRGCDQLLRNGAKLVEDGDDVLIEFASLVELRAPCESISNTTIDALPTDDPAYAKLANLLGFEPISASDLMAGAGLTSAELSSMLLLLELEGHVEALPGGRYCRLSKRS